MDILTLQTFLNSKGAKLQADGLLGAKTLKAAEAYIRSAGNPDGLADWSSDRLMIALEQALYADLKIETGVIDGLVGEDTRQARRVYADKAEGTWRDKLLEPRDPITDTLTKEWPRQRDVPSFFGAPGENLVRLSLPFPFRLAWDPAKTVQTTMVNAKCRDAFSAIWTKTLEHYTLGGLRTLRLDMFGGAFNIRKMRGGSALSMHSFGIAWDVDPERNQLKWNRSRASLDGKEYDKFWSFVEAEGGVSLGRARDFDWMHFQFARL